MLGRIHMNPVFSNERMVLMINVHTLFATNGQN